MPTTSTHQRAGAALDRLIKKSRISRTKIANSLGIQRDALLDLCQGRRRFTIQLVARIAELLGAHEVNASQLREMAAESEADPKAPRASCVRPELAALGACLLGIRQELNLRPSQFAALLGIAQSNLHAYEHGHRRMSPATAAKVAERLALPKDKCSELFNLVNAAEDPKGFLARTSQASPLIGWLEGECAGRKLLIHSGDRIVNSVPPSCAGKMEVALSSLERKLKEAVLHLAQRAPGGALDRLPVSGAVQHRDGRLTVIFLESVTV